MKRGPLSPVFFTLLLPLLMVALVGAEQGAWGQNNETIENKVPKHLPIKVEILYRKGAKLLENAEIKVTNTGEKPIYSLHFGVSTADDPSFAMKHGVSRLYFGRSDLMTFGNFANNNDPSLKRGESIFLELSRKRVEGFRNAMRNSRGSMPEKYELFFQFLSFGDDTGFWTTGGVPFPSKKEPPFVNATDRPSFFFEPQINSCSTSQSSISFFELLTPSKQTTKQDFFVSSLQTPACPYSCGTLNGAPCYKARPSTLGCCPNPEEPATVPWVEFAAGCNDPGYECAYPNYRSIHCPSGGGCQYEIVLDACATAQCVDADGDGHFAIDPLCPQGDDCDDMDAERKPGTQSFATTARLRTRTVMTAQTVKIHTAGPGKRPSVMNSAIMTPTVITKNHVVGMIVTTTV
jgi:hypothetical protein